MSKFISIKDELTFASIKGCAILIIAGTRTPFTFTELDAIQNYLDDGGKVFVLLAEGSLISQSNINIFLEKYGIIPNAGMLLLYIIKIILNICFLFRLCNKNSLL